MSWKKSIGIRFGLLHRNGSIAGILQASRASSDATDKLV
jgi:hypothetical protein